MKSIRIGTRNSPLALWQANEAARKLKSLGIDCQIVPVLSSGDKNLSQPLYSMGITGVFTRDLDAALLNDEIDIAVHSLKDVPTILPENISLFAFLERDFPQDVLVRNSKSKAKPIENLKVATSSLRRRAFWLKEFPNTEFTDIRGNVQTRLQKIEDGLADATIFSLAGLKRLALNIDYELLPFMLNAASQGVITIAGRTDNQWISSILNQINHEETALCVQAEREFLQTMEGGCTAPIGAFAEIENGKMRLVGRLCSIDGKDCVETDETTDIQYVAGFGSRLAQKVLENGGKEIMDALRKMNVGS
ncbi:hydroxymethylbilane synthase [Cruoricaptor ignavus]|uniref:Hydroxymethylbilane synthase n=2 Tax=Cruoricaptor ignavus TaxID=1118202 RepID=A0A1M6AV03_9FLAO|nr:hydroxymethylbilane synthase [Cruoricaptor ignavus]SHI40053.1 hydroxymethylbilane synthase [Cruoricaptor ignavus]